MKEVKDKEFCHDAMFRSLLITNTEVKISLSGQELGELFWQMGAWEQQKFFSVLGNKSRFLSQLQAIKDLKHDDEASNAMRQIGEYS